MALPLDKYLRDAAVVAPSIRAIRREAERFMYHPAEVSEDAYALELERQTAVHLIHNIACFTIAKWYASKGYKVRDMENDFEIEVRNLLNFSPDILICINGQMMIIDIKTGVNRMRMAEQAVAAVQKYEEEVLPRIEQMGYVGTVYTHNFGKLASSTAFIDEHRKYQPFLNDAIRETFREDTRGPNVAFDFWYQLAQGAQPDWLSDNHAFEEANSKTSKSFLGLAEDACQLRLGVSSSELKHLCKETKSTMRHVGNSLRSTLLKYEKNAGVERFEDLPVQVRRAQKKCADDPGVPVMERALSLPWIVRECHVEQVCWESMSSEEPRGNFLKATMMALTGGKEYTDFVAKPERMEIKRRTTRSSDVTQSQLYSSASKSGEFAAKIGLIGQAPNQKKKLVSGSLQPWIAANYEKNVISLTTLKHTRNYVDNSFKEGCELLSGTTGIDVKEMTSDTFWPTSAYAQGRLAKVLLPIKDRIPGSVSVVNYDNLGYIVFKKSSNITLVMPFLILPKTDNYTLHVFEELSSTIGGYWQGIELMYGEKYVAVIGHMVKLPLKVVQLWLTIDAGIANGCAFAYEPEGLNCELFEWFCHLVKQTAERHSGPAESARALQAIERSKWSRKPAMYQVFQKKILEGKEKFTSPFTIWLLHKILDTAIISQQWFMESEEHTSWGMQPNGKLDLSSKIACPMVASFFTPQIHKVRLVFLFGAMRQIRHVARMSRNNSAVLSRLYREMITMTEKQLGMIAISHSGVLVDGHFCLRLGETVEKNLEIADRIATDPQGSQMDGMPILCMAGSLSRLESIKMNITNKQDRIIRASKWKKAFLSTLNKKSTFVKATLNKQTNLERGMDRLETVNDYGATVHEMINESAERLDGRTHAHMFTKPEAGTENREIEVPEQEQHALQKFNEAISRACTDCRNINKFANQPSVLIYQNANNKFMSALARDGIDPDKHRLLRSAIDLTKYSPMMIGPLQFLKVIGVWFALSEMGYDRLAAVFMYTSLSGGALEMTPVHIPINIREESVKWWLLDHLPEEVGSYFFSKGGMPISTNKVQSCINAYQKRKNLKNDQGVADGIVEDDISLKQGDTRFSFFVDLEILTWLKKCREKGAHYLPLGMMNGYNQGENTAAVQWSWEYVCQIYFCNNLDPLDWGEELAPEFHEEHDKTKFIKLTKSEDLWIGNFFYSDDLQVFLAAERNFDLQDIVEKTVAMFPVIGHMANLSKVVSSETSCEMLGILSIKSSVIPDTIYKLSNLAMSYHDSPIMLGHDQQIHSAAKSGKAEGIPILAIVLLHLMSRHYLRGAEMTIVNKADKFPSDAKLAKIVPMPTIKLSYGSRLNKVQEIAPKVITSCVAFELDEYLFFPTNYPLDLVKFHRSTDMEEKKILYAKYKLASQSAYKVSDANDWERRKRITGKAAAGFTTTLKATKTNKVMAKRLKRIGEKLLRAVKNSPTDAVAFEIIEKLPTGLKSLLEQFDLFKPGLPISTYRSLERISTTRLYESETDQLEKITEAYKRRNKPCILIPSSLYSKADLEAIAKKQISKMGDVTTFKNWSETLSKEKDKDPWIIGEVEALLLIHQISESVTDDQVGQYDILAVFPEIRVTSHIRKMQGDLRLFMDRKKFQIGEEGLVVTRCPNFENMTFSKKTFVFGMLANMLSPQELVELKNVMDVHYMSGAQPASVLISRLLTNEEDFLVMMDILLGSITNVISTWTVSVGATIEMDDFLTTWLWDRVSYFVSVESDAYPDTVPPQVDIIDYIEARQQMMWGVYGLHMAGDLSVKGLQRLMSENPELHSRLRLAASVPQNDDKSLSKFLDLVAGSYAIGRRVHSHSFSPNTIFNRDTFRSNGRTTQVYVMQGSKTLYTQGAAMEVTVGSEVEIVVTANIVNLGFEDMQAIRLELMKTLGILKIMNGYLYYVCQASSGQFISQNPDHMFEHGLSGIIAAKTMFLNFTRATDDGDGIINVFGNHFTTDATGTRLKNVSVGNVPIPTKAITHTISGIRYDRSSHALKVDIDASTGPQQERINLNYPKESHTSLSTKGVPRRLQLTRIGHTMNCYVKTTEGSAPTVRQHKPTSFIIVDDPQKASAVLKHIQSVATQALDEEKLKIVTATPREETCPYLSATYAALYVHAGLLALENVGVLCVYEGMLVCKGGRAAWLTKEHEPPVVLLSLAIAQAEQAMKQFKNYHPTHINCATVELDEVGKLFKNCIITSLQISNPGPVMIVDPHATAVRCYNRPTKVPTMAILAPDCAVTMDSTEEEAVKRYKHIVMNWPMAGPVLHAMLKAESFSAWLTRVSIVKEWGFLVNRKRMSTEHISALKTLIQQYTPRSYSEAVLLYAGVTNSFSNVMWQLEESRDVDLEGYELLKECEITTEETQDVVSLPESITLEESAPYVQRNFKGNKMHVPPPIMTIPWIEQNLNNLVSICVPFKHYSSFKMFFKKAKYSEASTHEVLSLVRWIWHGEASNTTTTEENLREVLLYPKHMPLKSGTLIRFLRQVRKLETHLISRYVGNADAVAALLSETLIDPRVEEIYRYKSVSSPVNKNLAREYAGIGKETFRTRAMLQIDEDRFATINKINLILRGANRTRHDLQLANKLIFHQMYVDMDSFPQSINLVDVLNFEEQAILSLVNQTDSTFENTVALINAIVNAWPELTMTSYSDLTSAWRKAAHDASSKTSKRGFLRVRIGNRTREHNITSWPNWEEKYEEGKLKIFQSMQQANNFLGSKKKLELNTIVSQGGPDAAHATTLLASAILEIAELVEVIQDEINGEKDSSLLTRMFFRTQLGHGADKGAKTIELLSKHSEREICDAVEDKIRSTVIEATSRTFTINTVVREEFTEMLTFECDLKEVFGEIKNTLELLAPSAAGLVISTSEYWEERDLARSDKDWPVLGSELTWHEQVEAEGAMKWGSK